jgi:hypothetical protein
MSDGWDESDDESFNPDDYVSLPPMPYGGIIEKKRLLAPGSSGQDSDFKFHEVNASDPTSWTEAWSRGLGQYTRVWHDFVAVHDDDEGTFHCRLCDEDERALPPTMTGGSGGRESPPVRRTGRDMTEHCPFCPTFASSSSRCAGPTPTSASTCSKS